MTTQTSCHFSFYTSLDGTRTVRIPNPIENIAVTSVLTAAGRIANANPFDETVGTLEGIRRIEVVTIGRNELFRV